MDMKTLQAHSACRRYPEETEIRRRFELLATSPISFPPNLENIRRGVHDFVLVFRWHSVHCHQRFRPFRVPSQWKARPLSGSSRLRSQRSRFSNWTPPLFPAARAPREVYPFSRIRWRGGLAHSLISAGVRRSCEKKNADTALIQHVSPLSFPMRLPQISFERQCRPQSRLLRCNGRRACPIERHERMLCSSLGR